MKFTFVPDYLFSAFDEMSADFLVGIGIKGVILDIDNTLEPYENPEPGERVRTWLGALADRGIGCAFVSNNDRQRVERFNAELGLPAFYKAGKPFKKNILLAMKQLGSDNTNTIMLGDQIYTDVWAARNAGILAAVVPPIKDKTDVFTKFKRLLEKPVFAKYRKLRGKGDEK